MDKQHISLAEWLRGESLRLWHWVVSFSILLEPASRSHLKGQEDRIGGCKQYSSPTVPSSPLETRHFPSLPLPRFARVRAGTPAFPACLLACASLLHEGK